MSTNYGRSATDNNTWVQNTGSNNQYGFRIFNVPKGVISFLDVYMACSGSTMNAALCLWDDGGNLLAQSNVFTCPAGSGGVNGQSLQRQALTTPYRSSGLANYYVGFWRDPAKTAEWSYKTGTSTIHPQAPGGSIGNVGGPSNLNLSNGTSGEMTAFLEWDPGDIYAGPNGGGAPVIVQAIYAGPNGGGAPVLVLGVYVGPAGGGAPVRIW